MTALTRLFPLWAVLGCAYAVWQPEQLAALKPAIVPLLGLVMFGMGATLRSEDFRRALQRPGVILLGITLQFILMPLLAWILSWGLGLPLMLMVGMVLVGTCPGGTASNVICYLSGGDTALSITMTTFSTLASVLCTPLLTYLILQQEIPVPALEMLWSIVKIILLPVSLGLLLNRYFTGMIRPLATFFPALSVLSIVVIIAIIVALNSERLATLALPVLLAVMLHNLLGLGLAYGVCRLLNQDETTCRTISIEVGMQNSGLAVALAIKYFSLSAALPAALFSIWHNLSGSLLAAWWSRCPPEDKGRAQAVSDKNS